MKLREIYAKIIVESTVNNILYHGTNEEHDFTSIGNIGEGTFFAKDINTAKTFGNYVYKVALKPNVKILDVTTNKGSQWILDNFDALYDTYYDEGEDGYKIEDADTLSNHSDSWEAIENTRGVVNAIRESEYDGYAATEGGDKTYFLFSPVEEKIESFKLIG